MKRLIKNEKTYFIESFYIYCQKSKSLYPNGYPRRNELEVNIFPADTYADQLMSEKKPCWRRFGIFSRAEVDWK
jgi:hypothetical protein